LLLGQSGYREEEERALVGAFLGRGVDALLLIGVKHARGVRATLQRAGTPVVETWDLTGRPIDMLVGFSNHDAGRAAARHLIGKGYGSLGFIGGVDDRSVSRLAGLRAEAEANGLGGVDVAQVPAPSSVPDGCSGLAELMDRGSPPRAVFCTNDMLAAGALFECQRRRIDVPGRIALMGFADLPIAASLEPALTTVQVRAHAMGQRAGELMVSRLTGAPHRERIVDLGFAVIDRSSA
jgi:LacI family gluconate utilization system Gnt-I transcriptional repressor